SFTKADDGLKTEMSNAVFSVKKLNFEDIDEEVENRCFSIKVDRRLNPHPINEEDVLDCSGRVPEQLEESLDDQEKLLDL
ncbi:hypothetical protein, partial [Klebsiella aerogenes]|uniref:hypothetical protein n=1 Tax=Klebsiella aerogenes TaxID=548 RepID=UPI001CC5A02C